jgi:hypothetical protein
MAARLEALTTDLGAQVRRATADLADRNVELQTANDRLWEAQLELGRSDRMAALGQMAGTLAHGLGTPLNSVLGYVQLLRREPLAAGQGEKLAIVESQLQRMIEDMRGVLDRTRDVPLRRTPLAIAPVVNDALALVSSRAAGRRIDLRARVADDLPPVPAEAVGLRQVLLNLLANAIDATPDGGHIAVGARRPPPRMGAAAGLSVPTAATACRRSSAARPRAVLHDESPRSRHRPRPRHRRPHRARARRHDAVDSVPASARRSGSAAVEGVMARVLIVDDDAVSCQLIAEVLHGDGVQVS